MLRYICFKNLIVRFSRHPCLNFFMRINFIQDNNICNSIKMRSRRLLGPSTHLFYLVKVKHEYKLLIFHFNCSRIWMTFKKYIKTIVRNVINYQEMSEKLMDDNSAIQIPIVKKSHNLTFQKSSPRSDVITIIKYRITNYKWRQNKIH